MFERITIEDSEVINLIEFEEALIKIISSANSLTSKKISVTQADPKNNWEAIDNWDFILQQIADPVHKRPFHAFTKPEQIKQQAAGKLTCYNPFTGEMYTRKTSKVRGRAKPSDYIFTKKTATTLLPTDGIMHLFSDSDTGLLFSLPHCLLKRDEDGNHKYTFETNASTNSRWWIGGKGSHHRAVTLEAIREANRNARAKAKITNHNEILACLSRQAVRAIIIYNPEGSEAENENELLTKIKGIYAKYRVLNTLNLDVPIVIISDTAPIHFYEPREQLLDLKQMVLKNDFYFSQTIMLIARLAPEVYQEVMQQAENLKQFPMQSINNFQFNLKDLTSATFAGSTLLNVTFTDTNLQAADFTGCKLTDVSFRNVNLTNVSFKDATLTKVNFDNATLTRANFTKCKLTKTNFNAAILPEANFSYALINSSGFPNANLSKSIMTKAYIKIVNFDSANLTEIDFTQTSITQCDFKNSKLDRTLIDNDVLSKILKSDSTAFQGTIFANLKEKHLSAMSFRVNDPRKNLITTLENYVKNAPKIKSVFFRNDYPVKFIKKLIVEQNKYSSVEAILNHIATNCPHLPTKSRLYKILSCMEKQLSKGDNLTLRFPR